MSTDTLNATLGADPVGQTVLGGGTGAAGTAGTVIHSGNGAPGSGVGVNGDFYVDITNGIFYGPKASGSWLIAPAISMVGPTGPAGATGATGAAGADGDSGGVLDGVWRRPEFVNTDTYLTTTLLADRIYLTRHRAPRNAKLKSLKWWNGPNSVLSGVNAKAVVYTPGTNGWPSARAYVSAAQALSNSNSTYTLSSINVNIDAGEVWMGLIFDGAIGATSNLAGLSARFGGITTNPIGGTSTNVDAIAYDSAYSSPADPIGSLTRVNLNGNTCPLVYPEWDRR